jgi:uncharacterized RDD family membrane protein YckC
VALRFGALVIDLVFIIVSLFVAALIAAPFGDRNPITGDYSAAYYIVIWTWFFMSLLYSPFCWWRFGCTLGQRAVGIRVVREADGLRLRIGAVVLRYVVWFVCLLTVILAVIAAIMADAEPAKRAWHDEASGSVVIKPMH